MKLPYDSAEMVRILDSDSLTVATFNQMVKKFIINDLSFASSSDDIPRVWENRWYNSPDDASLCYNKGDAVWVNCHAEDEFIQSNWDTLSKYASQNISTRAEYNALLDSGDTSRIAEFFGEVIRGYRGNQPLFYLGDLRQPIRIRISLVDGNRYPPSDEFTLSEGNTVNVYWRDFFQVSTKTEVLRWIQRYFEERATARETEHMRDFHMVGLDQPQSFMDQHLHSDFSNMVYAHRMKSHYWYDPRLRNGFDSVTRFVKRNTSDGGVQWFRQWSSGYLEHGGIVGISDSNGDNVGGCCSPVGNDSKFMRVHFNWSYNGGQSQAPVYNYPSDLLHKPYLGSTEVFAGQSQSGPFDVSAEFSMPRMGSIYRYSVSVNGIRSLESPNTPYQQQSDNGNLAYFCVKDVFDQTNDGFSFVLNSEAQKYAYCVSGFVVGTT